MTFNHKQIFSDLPNFFFEEPIDLSSVKSIMHIDQLKVIESKKFDAKEFENILDELTLKRKSSKDIVIVDYISSLCSGLNLVQFKNCSVSNYNNNDVRYNPQTGHMEVYQNGNWIQQSNNV